MHVSSREASLPALARAVLALARAHGLTIATAESCTGGLVAATLTGVAGASDVFDAAFVTYSNAAKTALLGVPAGVIEAMGAVSAEVAAAMALGALRASRASLVVAITGIAGPGGGSARKPVGLVHLAAAAADGRAHRLERHYNPGAGRAAIRRAATRDALLLLRELAQDSRISA